MDSQINTTKKKNFRINSYHQFYKRKGVYKFFYQNSLKVLFFLGLIIGGIFVLKFFVPDFDQQLEAILASFNPVLAIIVFFLSESLFGLIPPDFFIIWSQNFEYPYLMVTFLSILSYIGGIVSYFIGKYIGSLPKVEAWIVKKFVRHLDLIRKWGGVLVVFGAIFPLPFSIVCMMAGIIRFPFKTFLLLGLFRFIRFFGYALVLFSVV